MCGVVVREPGCHINVPVLVMVAEGAVPVIYDFCWRGVDRGPFFSQFFALVSDAVILCVEYNAKRATLDRLNANLFAPLHLPLDPKYNHPPSCVYQQHLGVVERKMLLVPPLMYNTELPYYCDLL